jgi:hypothetical protein
MSQFQVLRRECISIMGSIANFLYSISFGSLIRIYGLLIFLMHGISSKWESSQWDWKTIKFWMIIIPYIIVTVFLFTIYTTVIYPFANYLDFIDKIDFYEDTNHNSILSFTYILNANKQHHAVFDSTRATHIRQTSPPSSAVPDTVAGDRNKSKRQPSIQSFVANEDDGNKEVPNFRLVASLIVLRYMQLSIYCFSIETELYPMITILLRTP